jgi:hypothetical protein
MSIDQCQPAVEIALQKEGWKIIFSPSHHAIKPENFYIDLEAEYLVENGNGQPEKIFIEVKCFPGEDKFAREDFYEAVGQYITYRTVLRVRGIDADLYLAVPTHIYSQFKAIIKQVLVDNRINILLVDLAEERITEWIK